MVLREKGVHHLVFRSSEEKLGGKERRGGKGRVVDLNLSKLPLCT